MAKTSGKARKRALAVDRGRPRARKSSVTKTTKSGASKSGASKSSASKAKPSAGKQKASPASETARLKQQLKAARRQQREALERQTATADILRIISLSPGDVQPVFDALVLTARRLLRRELAFIIRRNENTFHPVAIAGPAGLVSILNPSPIPIDPSANFPSRAIVSKQSQQFPDWSAIDLPQEERDIRDLYRINSALYLPMLRGDECVGVLGLAGSEAGHFSEADIALAQSFSDQALIAIENTRLFNETQESLQQQTATSDVLKVISRAAFDLDSVMNTLTRSAAELCKAELSALYLRDGDLMVARGMAGVDGTRMQFLRDTPLRIEDSGAGRALLTGAVLNMADVEREGTDTTRKFGQTLGFNSILFVPLMREGHGIGVFALGRKRTGKYSPREVELLQTFADQAVIAVENTRLFNETREALEQQRASASVLSAISNSVAETQPVFDEILQSVAHLFGSQENYIFLVGEDELLHLGAGSGPRIAQVRTLFPAPFDGTVSEVAIRERRLVRSANVFDDPDLPAPARERYRRLGENYAMVVAPMLWEERAIGSIMVARASMEAFSDKECALLRSFADQAVIAIQNARLFNETKEALERQTATADILKVIASSPSDVQPVFEAIADRSNRLIGGQSTAVYSIADDIMHLMAFTRISPEADAALQASFPRPLSEAKWADRIRHGKVVEIADAHTEFAAYPDLLAMVKLRGYRSQLLVPLLHDGTTIGIISVTRVDAGAFAPHHIDLLQTFGDQAVIAIGNVRLFDEVQARTQELSKSLDDLRAAQDRLVQTEKLASLGQLTAGIAHEIKNPLNFVNNFAALSAELTDELDQTLAPAPLDETMRGEVGELTEMLKSNLEKVVQHGKRADSIVKNMLQHSRESSGERGSQDLNALVGESLNLAYHGARAERSDFNIILEQDFDPDAGAVDVYPQELTRALLNLISNGFYAAIKRKVEASGQAFEPVLTAATKNAGNAVEIRIRDNGTGIPPEIREKIFNPFFTTKPTGEGTGLGLSMTHDIIVKQHGGRIDVETEPGAFTEFIITLPRDIGGAGRLKSE